MCRVLNAGPTVIGAQHLVNANQRLATSRPPLHTDTLAQSFQPRPVRLALSLLSALLELLELRRAVHFQAGAGVEGSALWWHWRWAVPQRGLVSDCGRIAWNLLAPIKHRRPLQKGPEKRCGALLPDLRVTACSIPYGFLSGNIWWVWLKIKQEGQTAGLGPCFHFSGLQFGKFQLFEKLSDDQMSYGCGSNTAP